MPDFGFPAQPRQAVLASLIAGLRRDSDDARIETVTGRYADITRSMGGRVTEALHLEKSIRDLSSYDEAIALTEARASTIQAGLDQMVGSIQTLTDQTDLLRLNGTDQNLETLSYQARDTLDSLVSALNIDFGGRALFAGDESGGVALADAGTIFDTATTALEGHADAASAFAALEAEFMDPGGAFDTTFYQGGAGRAPSSDIAPGERVNYTVKADEAPFRQALMSVAALSAAFDTSNGIPDDQRRELLSFVATEMRSSIGGVIGIQGRLGSVEARISDVKARNVAAESALTIQYNDLTAADGFESALRLTEFENQLETAFSSTARIAQLSLAQYI